MQAVKKKSGATAITRKQHKEQAERERARYPTPRKRTKAE
jgi:hypothetical protein